MTAFLFLLMATAQPQPGARLSAVATARILPGARISLASQTVDQSTVDPQRSRILRREVGDAGLSEFRLVEFQ